jgi:hypothetical protein
VTARGSGLADRADWRPGGRLLSVAGQDAWTGTGDNWLGVTAPIWWSHAGAVTNPAGLALACLEVVGLQSVPEGDGGHALLWAQARRPGTPRAGAVGGR